uniref:Uncharacterized protein n=1 Tax=Anguilla anguilla TaxID=7936 RepID=A0A0E9TDJ2_ANGAN
MLFLLQGFRDTNDTFKASVAKHSRALSHTHAHTYTHTFHLYLSRAKIQSLYES